uniref:hypothetical protein n=1 Tax=Escherichia coli TaxID=562 RepID=UPI001F1D8ACB|nr:hypothetical protein [Escherichia coli]UGK56451.1 hypothetical protein [Escherichia coli]
MTNKILILSASCINEFASDVPQSVFFSIDTSLAKRIRELAAYVKENDLYAAEFFFYDCHWSETLEEDIEVLMSQAAFIESDSSGQGNDAPGRNALLPHGNNFHPGHERIISSDGCTPVIAAMT